MIAGKIKKWTMSKDKKLNLSNKEKQDIDKAPGEGRGQGEQVTQQDLKGKKVDGDPSVKEDQPVKQSSSED